MENAGLESDGRNSGSGKTAGPAGPTGRKVRLCQAVDTRQVFVGSFRYSDGRAVQSVIFQCCIFSDPSRFSAICQIGTPVIASHRSATMNSVECTVGRPLAGDDHQAGKEVGSVPGLTCSAVAPNSSGLVGHTWC